MSTSATMTHLAAAAVLNNDDKVTPGLLGFVVFAALGVATWFLLKSMNARMKRVDFVEEPEVTKE
ncbi:hypothetical protein P3T36_001396 [Kitasatospora sp. MAP12-15]|uniref:hypothetical protein n=1 Tax=unclassified Kitasatospora TaxID=2633591 RepID=UPI0024768804|nr:hypothetical protein [Kitasatospora sp. MAP12-44]MDH6112513.1 hypothetical protein [Kitasatospora sp. MAP12-44]